MEDEDEDEDEDEIMRDSRTSKVSAGKFGFLQRQRSLARVDMLLVSMHVEGWVA